MSPHSWATPEQEAFLSTLHEKYIQCQGKRDYSTFWAPFFEQWFTQFPERAVVLPDVPQDAELSEAQKIVIAKAVETRKEQLRNKLRNTWGAKKKGRAANSMDTKVVSNLIADLMQSKEGRSRKPQKIEAYLKLYYEEKIRPSLELAHDVTTVDAMVAASSDGPKPPKLATIMSKAREMFQKESPEVKALVDKRWSEMVAEKEQDLQVQKGNAPRDKQFYIDRLALMLGHFLNALHEATGWSFTVLMGGPTAETTIEVSSVHLGVTEIGNTFDRAYPEFANGIMRPYKEFLGRVSPVTKTAGKKACSVDLTSSGPASAQAVEPINSSAGEMGVAETTTMALGTSTLSALPQSACADSVGISSNAAVPSMAPPLVDAPLQLASPSKTLSWPDFLLAPPIQTGGILDDFSYKFGSETTIDSLDRFLEKYGEPPLVSTNGTALPPSVPLQLNGAMQTLQSATLLVSAPSLSLPNDPLSLGGATITLPPLATAAAFQMVTPVQGMECSSDSQPAVPSPSLPCPVSIDQQDTRTSTVPQATQTVAMVIAGNSQSTTPAPFLLQSTEPIPIVPQESSSATAQPIKRARQPSKRNEVANCIGGNGNTSKKHSLPSGDGKNGQAKKRKTK